MDLRVTLEWNEKCGLLIEEMFPFIDGIVKPFEAFEYGNSISKLFIVIVGLDSDYKQRKRFDKKSRIFSYDVMLDFYLLKNIDKEDKKKLIRYQTIKYTKETFKKYRFENFDTNRFLEDFERVVGNLIF